MSKRRVESLPPLYTLGRPSFPSLGGSGAKWPLVPKAYRGTRRGRSRKWPTINWTFGHRMSPPPRSYSNLFPVSSTFFTVKLIHPQRGGDLPLHPLSTISSRFAHCRNEVRISFQLSDKSATCRGRLRGYNLKRRNCATGRWLKNFIENFPRKERRRLKLSKVFLHDVNIVCYFY